LIDGIGGSFDTVPDLTFGCSPEFTCDIYTPYALNGGGTIEMSVSSNSGNEFCDDTFMVFIDSNADVGISDFEVYARWTLASGVASVPEPGSALLFAVGLPLVARRLRAIASS
jgi:hypothetical protein